MNRIFLLFLYWTCSNFVGAEKEWEGNQYSTEPEIGEQFLPKYKRDIQNYIMTGVFIRFHVCFTQ